MLDCPSSSGAALKLCSEGSVAFKDWFVSATPTPFTGRVKRQLSITLSSIEVPPAAIAWSSFAFAVLQSVCTFFTALSGLRLVVGIGAFAAMTQAGATWDRMHADWIRVPMVLLAVAGSVLNLLILRRIWRLRSLPASQWRQNKPSWRKIASERVQLALALITLVLVGLEEITHFRTFHHF